MTNPSGTGGANRQPLARDSNGSITGRSQIRLNDSQSFGSSHNSPGAPRPRMMRLNSIAVTRGASSAAIVGRPIVWTKQTTLQKGSGLAYASQPANIALSMSGQNAMDGMIMGKSNTSGIADEQSNRSSSLRQQESEYSINVAGGGINGPERNTSSSSNNNPIASSSGAFAVNRQQNFSAVGSSVASVTGVTSTIRSQDRQQLSQSQQQAQRQSSNQGSIVNISTPLTRGDPTTSSRHGIRDSTSMRSSKNQINLVGVSGGANAVAQISVFSNSTIGAVAGMGTTSNPMSKSSEVASNYSRRYDDIIKQIGNPLRGPITIELFAHYISFLLILFIAWKTSWAPQIRFYLAFVYFFVSCIALQISRLISSRYPNSSAPFYVSFIPLAILIFISREVHQIVVLLWFISMLVIFLQSGHPRLFQHLISFCVVYVATYAVVLVVMYYSYWSGCTGMLCNVALNTPIVPLKEAVLMADCIFVMFIFSRLERFIKLNASTLLDHENYMQHLYIANMDLKRQLRNAKIENEVDLEAPLTRATQILNEVKEVQDLDPEIMQELNFIINLLSSDKLFQPDLFQNSNDADVHDWLKDILLTEKVTDPPVAGAIGTAGIAPVDPTAAAAMVIPGRLPAIGLSVDHAILSLTISDQSAFEMLSDVQNPEFDVMELEVITGGHALYYLGWYIFRQHKLSESLHINEDKFRHLLIKLESGYRRNNPYHNSTHAADVTHAMNYFTTRQRIWKMLRPEEQLSVLVSPIIHDYAHPGVNNAFLMSTSNALALRYNDQSILEHFHSSSFFELVAQDEYNILESLTVDQRKVVRELIPSMVLATDMASHFDWIGKFKGKMSGTGINYDNKVDKKMVLNVAIKCSDVNNPTKPGLISRRWTQMIMEEFFRQGDEEKKLGIPISTFMNRETTDTPKCQIGFIEFIVNPLYEAWALYMHEDVEVHLRNIQANKAFWKSCTESPSLFTQVPIPTFTVVPTHALMNSSHSVAPSTAAAAVPITTREHTAALQSETVSPALSGGSNASNIINSTITENPMSPGNDRIGHSGFPRASPLPDIRSHSTAAGSAPSSSAAIALMNSGVTSSRQR